LFKENYFQYFCYPVTETVIITCLSSKVAFRRAGLNKNLEDPCIYRSPTLDWVKEDVHVNKYVKYYSEVFFLRGEGPRSRCYGRTAALRLLVQPLWWRWAVFFCQVLQLMEHQWNEIDRGKPTTTRRKTCPSATLSTTNLTWTDPGSNPGLRGERPATNRLSHGTAYSEVVTIYSYSAVPSFTGGWEIDFCHWTHSSLSQSEGSSWNNNCLATGRVDKFTFFPVITRSHHAFDAVPSVPLKSPYNMRINVLGSTEESRM
jgi:hypothetical protein